MKSVKWAGRQRMQSINWKSVLRHVFAFWGDAQQFENTEGASRVMTDFSGPVMWLESIEAERGYGSEAMKELLNFAKLTGIQHIGLSVVPLGDATEEQLVRFYQRHGFVLRPDFAPWSDHPVMVADLHRTFGGIA